MPGHRTFSRGLVSLLAFPSLLWGCSNFEGQRDASVADAAPDAGVADARPPDAGPDDPSQSFVLLHTADEHSGYLGHGPELDDFPITTTEVRDVRGGLLRRAAVLQKLEEEARQPPFSSPVAIVGAGGRMTGSLFQLANIGLGIDFAVTTVIGYDVLGLGPSDFELGTGVLAGTLETGGVSPMFDPGIYDLPVVASNLRFSMTVPDDDRLAALYLPEGGADRPLRRYHVQRFGDVLVGFVGVMGIEAAFSATFKFPVRFSLATDPFRPCTIDAQCPGSVCLPPANDPTALEGRCAVNVNELDAATHGVQWVADIASAVGELRRRNVDLVVALSSGGVDENELAELAARGQRPEQATRSEDIQLAKGVDMILGTSGVAGIDVIVSSFTGATLEAPIEVTNPTSGRKTVIVQAGTDGEWVGALRLTRPDREASWSVDPAFSRLVPIDGMVDTSTPGLSSVTTVVLETLIEQTIENLEGVPAAIEDGIVFPGEQCDRAAFPNQRRCAPIVPAATGGQLACFDNRQLDLSACEFDFASCGNARRDGEEMCDAADLGGTTCEALGYDGGTLSCLTNCSFDVSACERDFPSILEILFRLLAAATDLPRVIDDPEVLGDLYFFEVGRSDFDLPRTRESRESNLIDFVADAQRWSVNSKVPRMADDPVRMTIAANAVVAQGIHQGRTGVLSMADLFRVLPLGLSPQEQSPGFVLTDFWLRPDELRRALELGVGPGLDRERFWFGVSGARVEYDPSRPEFDRITRITLARTGTETPWLDGAGRLEAEPIFDRARAGGPIPEPERLIHVGANLWVALLIEGSGVCPRDASGRPALECQPCAEVAECPVATTSCNLTAGRCTGQPGTFQFRTLFPFQASRAGGFLNPNHFEPFWAEEFKDFYSLLVYFDALPGRMIPEEYAAPVPRRLCCAGASCGTGRTCP